MLINVNGFISLNYVYGVPLRYLSLRELHHKEGLTCTRYPEFGHGMDLSNKMLALKTKIYIVGNL